MSNYATEIWRQVEQETVAIESHLHMASSKKAGNDKKNVDNPPLMLYDKHSRFDFIIINKDRKISKMSIPALSKGTGKNGIETLIRRTKHVYNMDLDERLNGISENKESSPAYIEKIQIGLFKGKTPAAVLLENPQNAKALFDTGVYLKENTTEKFRVMNEKQMYAIREALKLHKAGELKNVVNEYTLYETDVHVNTYPSGRREKDNKNKCSQMRIAWEKGAKRPVSIRIRNFWALSKTNDNGLINYISDSIDPVDVVDNIVRIEAENFMDAISTIQRNMNAFERCVSGYCFKDAKKIEASFKTGYYEDLPFVKKEN